MNLTQGQLLNSACYTKLKSIWEELSLYKLGCSCSWGGVKILQDYYYTKYVMSFLMGLSESYAQARGQILLMDPIPSINKIFSLITQEKK